MTLSLYSKKDVIKKLLDTSLLLLILAYIEIWSLLLLIFLYIALLIYGHKNFRYYIIPLYVFSIVSFSLFAFQKILKFDFFNELYSRFSLPNFIDFSNFFSRNLRENNYLEMSEKINQKNVK